MWTARELAPSSKARTAKRQSDSTVSLGRPRGTQKYKPLKIANNSTSIGFERYTSRWVTTAVTDPWSSRSMNLVPTRCWFGKIAPSTLIFQVLGSSGRHCHLDKLGVVTLQCASLKSAQSERAWLTASEEGVILDSNMEVLGLCHNPHAIATRSSSLSWQLIMHCNKTSQGSLVGEEKEESNGRFCHTPVVVEHSNRAW